MRAGERVKLKEQHVTARLQLNASAGRHDGVGILLQGSGTRTGKEEP
jgi:hypothetical protein